MIYLILASTIRKKRRANKSRKKKQKRPRRCTTSTFLPGLNQTPELRRSITELPHQILVDIISRLPFKTILCCRWVSKEWLDLISHSYEFATLHLSRSRVELVAKPRATENTQKAVYIVDEADMTGGFGVSVPINLRFELPLSDYLLVNECRGFLCLRDKFFYSNPSIVCNPITGEYIFLPKPNEYGVTWNALVSGFGFCPSSKEYKVLRICWKTTAIHTLGSDSWRSISNPPYSPLDIYSCPTFLNAALHWVYEHMSDSKCILSFDFEKEEFLEISFPSSFGEDQKKGENAVNIGILNECLFVCDLFPFGHFDVWVMKEYGVQESWSKDFVINTLATNVLHNRSFRPIKCLRNGEILMICSEHTLVCYDQQSKGLRYLTFTGIHTKFESLMSPSFVSFKDILKNCNVEVLNVKSRCSKVDLKEEREALFLKEYNSRAVGTEPRITSWC